MQISKLKCWIESKYTQSLLPLLDPKAAGLQKAATTETWEPSRLHSNMVMGKEQSLLVNYSMSMTLESIEDIVCHFHVAFLVS